MWGGVLACSIIVSAPVPVPFLWTLDLELGFGTWIWDLDLGLGFGTGLGLDNFHENLNCYPVNTDLYAIASEKPLCMEINPI